MVIEEAFLYWLFSMLAELAICVILTVFEITLARLCPLVVSAVMGTVVSFLRGRAQGCCWSPVWSCGDSLHGQDGGSMTASLLNLVSTVDKNSFLNTPVALRMRFFLSVFTPETGICGEQRSHTKTSLTDPSRNKGALGYPHDVWCNFIQAVNWGKLCEMS